MALSVINYFLPCGLDLIYETLLASFYYIPISTENIQSDGTIECIIHPDLHAHYVKSVILMSFVFLGKEGRSTRNCSRIFILCYSRPKAYYDIILFMSRVNPFLSYISSETDNNLTQRPSTFIVS